MTKSEVLAKLEYFNMVHGVTLRAIAALGDQELDYRPKPDMRTPREIITFTLRNSSSRLFGPVGSTQRSPAVRILKTRQLRRK